MEKAKLRVQWTDDFLTGDHQIDNEHKTFFLKAQRIIVACELGRGDDEVVTALEFMREYAAEHFDHEERRMTEIAFPYIETHKAAHRSFLDQLELLEQELDQASDKKQLAGAIAQMAANWFARHIRLVDRPLVEHLRGK